MFAIWFNFRALLFEKSERTRTLPSLEVVVARFSRTAQNSQSILLVTHCFSLIQFSGKGNPVQEKDMGIKWQKLGFILDFNRAWKSVLDMNGQMPRQDDHDIKSHVMLRISSVMGVEEGCRAAHTSLLIR